MTTTVRAAFAVWRSAERWNLASVWTLKENNINQTAASASASIISAGLAAPIPALALITGQTLSFPVLAIWLIVVSLLGIVVAAGLRNQLLLRDRLPFPSGIVTAETMTEIHRGGREAHVRLRILGLAAILAAVSAGPALALAGRQSLAEVGPRVLGEPRDGLRSTAGLGEDGLGVGCADVG